MTTGVERRPSVFVWCLFLVVVCQLESSCRKQGGWVAIFILNKIEGRGERETPPPTMENLSNSGGMDDPEKNKKIKNGNPHIAVKFSSSTTVVAEPTRRRGAQKK